MSETKHTRGPWRWDRRDPYSVMGDGEELCRTREPADARLMAAAPEMLAALNRIIRELDVTLREKGTMSRIAKELSHGAILQIWEAVEKAEGRTDG